MLNTKMSTIDKKSTIVGNEELYLFNLPETQVGIKSCYPRAYYSKNTIAPGVPLLFEIPSTPNFLDVKNHTFELRLRVTRADGTIIDNTAPGGTDDTSIVNYALNTIFQQVKVHCNGKTIFDSDSTYGYKSMFEAILGTSKDQKETAMAPSLFFMDGAGVDLSTMVAAGMTARKNRIDQSRTLVLTGGLHVDIFNQNKVWPPFMPFTIELFAHSPEFSIFSVTANARYRVQITQAKLYFRHIECLPSVYNAFEEELRGSFGCKYAFRRSNIKQLNLAQGETDIPMHHLYTGILPRRVVVAFVSSNSFNGAYARNPFNFRHYDIEKIQILCGGKRYPHDPLEMNFNEESYVPAYNMLTETMKINETTGCGLNMGQFTSGNTFFCFDLTPDLHANDNMYLNTINTGSIELSLRFRVGLPHNIKVLTYFEHDSIYTIDHYRNVFVDYKI